jgi:hypothetical protein
MGDLEEVLKRKYRLVDLWDVRHQQLLLIVISLIIFVSYGAFLWLLCSLAPSLLVVLLLAGTQMGLGLPLTRAYSEFGVSIRKAMKAYDAGLHSFKKNTTDVVIGTGELPLVFEQLELQISKYDTGRLDDLTDISWFLVIVWSMVSSIAHYISFLNQVLYLMGVAVLLSSCFMSYASGYWARSDNYLEEDMHHLEYYVTTFVKALDTIVPRLNGKVILRLIDKRRSSILVDIVLEFIFSATATLEYHFALASSLQECFTIEAPSEVVTSLYQDLVHSNSIAHMSWTIECMKTESGEIIRIMKPKHRLNISDKSSYIQSPDVVVQLSKETGKVFSAIVASTERHL